MTKQAARHYLVTGGAGFIGHHLTAALLSKGHKVRVLDDLSSGLAARVATGAEFLEGDITDKDTLRGAFEGVDGCFHLAAISSVRQAHRNKRRFQEVNLDGTLRVLDMAAARHIPAVIASSAAVYGDTDRLPVTEDMPVHPISHYGLFKADGENHAAKLVRQKATAAGSIRIFNCYGPGMRSDDAYASVIACFIERITQGLPVTIYGDGAQSRDFIHVNDVVALFIAVMEKLHREPGYIVVNACTGKSVTVLELAKCISALCGRELHVVLEPAHVDSIVHSQGSARKAADILEWKAVTDLESGLRGLLPATV